jgi:hypothetical protein
MTKQIFLIFSFVGQEHLRQELKSYSEDLMNSKFLDEMAITLSPGILSVPGIAGYE